MGGMAPCCVVGTRWLGGLPTTVPGATWIEMTKMQAPQKKGGKQFKARSGQEWTVQVSEVHAVSKETLLLFPPWLSAFSFFSKARQEICRDNLVLVQGSKAKTDSRQKRTKGCKKSPEKIKEKTTTSNPRRGTWNNNGLQTMWPKHWPWAHDPMEIQLLAQPLKQMTEKAEVTTPNQGTSHCRRTVVQYTIPYNLHPLVSLSVI